MNDKLTVVINQKEYIQYLKIISNYNILLNALYNDASYSIYNNSLNFNDSVINSILNTIDHDKYIYTVKKLSIKK